MQRTISRYTNLFLICSLTLAINTWGQSFTASLIGTVKDASGAVIPGVSVHAINIRTGVKYTAVTDDLGLYRFLTLEPGEYRLEAELSGFKKYVREGIVLRVNQAAKEDVILEIGEISQVVEVRGAAPLLETEKSDLGAFIDQKFILDLPTLGRNAFAFVTLSPGVRSNALFGSRGIFTSDFMVNGGRANTNDVLLDGAPNVVGDFNGIALVPPLDSVQEFKLQTSSYSAEFGRTGGGVVNVLTRSGANEYHGTVYDFHQNDNLNANSWDNNLRGIPKTEFKQNLFGANFGGPILKNRTFFFADYEGLRRTSPAQLLMRVPTELERRGDFSQTFDRNGNLVRIYNPFTTRRDPATGRFVRDQFSGNRIPQELFDPVAVKVLQLIPPPNRTPEDPSGRNNFLAIGSSRTGKDQFDIRIDHHLSEKHKMFGRFSYSRVVPTQNPNFWGNPASPSWLKIIDNMRNFVFDDTYSLSPTLLANWRYSFARFRANQRPGSFGFNPTTLGLPEEIARNSTQIMFPRFIIADMGETSVAGFNDQPRDTHSFIGGATKILGRHTVKSGFDIRILRFNAFQVFDSAGAFSFGRSFTQGPDPLVASPTAGFGVASFLLGTGGGAMNHKVPLSLQRVYYAGYLQDDIKVTSKLTLNLGLRYDLEVGQTERFDRLNFLDLKVPSPISSQVRDRLGRDLFGSLFFVGRDAGRNQRFTDKNNFGPRFGFAWHFASRAVLRGGYGVFYLPQFLEGEVGAHGSSSTTTWIGTLDGVMPLNLLRNPFPQGFNLPSGRSQGPLTDIGNAIFAPTRRERTPYVQDFSLGLQYEFLPNVLLEIDYVGSKGTKLPWANTAFNWNQLDPSLLSLGSDLLTLVDNPFFGVLPSTSQIGASQRIARRQLLRPFPQYADVIEVWNHAANSIYHSMQLKVEKRFGHGLQLLASYTVSKLIDYSGAIKGFLDRSGASANPQNFYDRRSERALSSFDVPQILKLSYTYELPLGRGRRFGSNMHPLLDAVIGGWQVNGITTFQSGVPLIFTAAAVSSSFSSVQRVNNDGRSGKLPKSQRSLDRWFDTGVFSQPAPFTFGNYARVSPDIRQDGTRNWDVSIFKNFPVRSLGEQARVQFRAEFFNAWNQVIFAAPVTSVTSTQFGRVLNAGGPRNVQLALKFYF